MGRWHDGNRRLEVARDRARLRDAHRRAPRSARSVLSGRWVVRAQAGDCEREGSLSWISRGSWDLTATERVRVASGIAASSQFTTSGRKYWHYGTSSCSERRGDKSGRSELATNSYAPLTARTRSVAVRSQIKPRCQYSHPFCCS